MLTELTVDQRTLARIFGVSQRTVQRWEAEGLDEARVDGSATYDLPAAVAWLTDRAADRSGMSTVREELEAARARKYQVDAMLREDELRTRRGELVPVGDVLGMVRKPLEAIDAKLRTAPRRLSQAWAARLGVSQAEAMAMIHDLVEDVRAELRAVFEEEPDAA